VGVRVDDLTRRAGATGLDQFVAGGHDHDPGPRPDDDVIDAARGQQAHERRADVGPCRRDHRARLQVLTGTPDERTPRRDVRHLDRDHARVGPADRDDGIRPRGQRRTGGDREAGTGRHAARTPRGRGHVPDDGQPDRRLRRGARDVVGPYGVPVDRGGVERRQRGLRGDLLREHAAVRVVQRQVQGPQRGDGGQDCGEVLGETGTSLRHEPPSVPETKPPPT
jgi:hypothetical protein